MTSTIYPSNEIAREFSKTELELAEFLKSLAHPARVSIIKVLAEKGECVCGEIVKVLPLAQSTVSQHIKQLRGTGLVKADISGSRSCYSIDKQRFAYLFQLMDEWKKEIEESQTKNSSLEDTSKDSPEQAAG